jgi:protein-tyrosine kinase
MLESLKKILENFMPNFYVTKSPREGIDTRLVSLADPSSYIAEQYKVLRTNLYTLSSASEKPLKTILITSSIPQEGKGITASNLALAISLEKKVLLIDADLRKPSIHALFGLPRTPGFSDLLNGSMDIEYFLKKPPIGNLYVMPSGSVINNPAEALNNLKVKKITDELKLKFDFIILDSPPVVNVTDALILAPLCDAVILVVKAEKTPKRLIEEALGLLIGVQAKPRACILTNTRISQYVHYYKHTQAAEKKDL